MLTINLAIFLPFLAALLIIILYKKSKATIHLGWFVLFIPVTLFIALGRFIPLTANGDVISYTVNWIPSFNINFTTYLDSLSLIFALLITGIGSLVVLYSIYYLTTDESLGHFYIYLLLFMGSMLGIVFADHLIIFYLFWELTSISSFLLIAFWYQRKGSRYGAQKSLLITIFGGLAMLSGFLMLYSMTGTFSIQEIITTIGTYKTDALFIATIILILLGAFTKSVQYPFHIWLPDAMEAPTPVSAYLHSATMVKAGIYLVARFTPVFGGHLAWFWLITSVGLLTLLWAAFTAIRQTDLKALLAYSTISQLGLIMSLFGVSSLSLHPDVQLAPILYTQAAFAALFHLVNHSTFKGALFMVIGIIDFRIGTRDIRRLGGLISLLPVSFTIALIGSFSMAGLPPFNGFLSKEMFFTAMLNLNHYDIFSIQNVAYLFPIIAWIASIFTFVYCMIIVFKTFTGNVKAREPLHIEEASVGMLISPVILVSLIVGIFLFPNILGDNLLNPALKSIYPQLTNITTAPISLWHGINIELLMTIGIIITGSLIYKSLNYWKIVYHLFPRKWSFDTIYHSTLNTIEKYSNKLTLRYMTGYLRHYFQYIFVIFIVSLSSLMIYKKAIHFDLSKDEPIGLFELLLAITIVIAGIAILFSKTRLTAILINGYIGFAIAMFFVIFRAPDLALTQLVIETVTTALFLLCFYFLPRWQDDDTPKEPLHFGNLAIAIGVGLTFTMIALSVNSGRLFDSIAHFFEKSDELTNSKNIVNTILGDFRAFDTMLEVIVLFIAGIGVYTLIKATKAKGAKDIED